MPVLKALNFRHSLILYNHLYGYLRSIVSLLYYKSDSAEGLASVVFISYCGIEKVVTSLLNIGLHNTYNTLLPIHAYKVIPQFKAVHIHVHKKTF